MALGVRARDVPGVAEEASVRAWLQTIRADLEQASFGAVSPELEWRGWLDSGLLAEELGCMTPLAIAAHARTLTAEPVPGGVIAISNARLGKTGAVDEDVVADWITVGGQGGLRRCRHCGCLHLAPNAALSHCWGSPSGNHELDEGGAFELPRAAEGEVHHQNCSSCHAVWAFDGNTRGHCPANPTGHTGGDRFSIAHADGGEWAECGACQRVVATALADRGCIDSTAEVPVAHTLHGAWPLRVPTEGFPTASWGLRAVAAALGVQGDLDATGRGLRPAPHPRFAERGPLPPVAAAWLAGWLPESRVHTVTFRPRTVTEFTLAAADAAAPAPVLLQIDAPGGVYGVELRSARGVDARLPEVERLQLRRFLGRGARGVDGWRACTSCGAAVDTAEFSCTRGGVHRFDAVDLAVPFDKGYVRAIPGFRRCVRCNGLWYEAGGGGGACSAGGDHRSDVATAYALRVSETGTGYRTCIKCRVLVDPQREHTGCAAGGTHDVRRSQFFSLDVVRRGASAHPGWATCTRCGVVAFTASQRCAKTKGPHTLEDRDHVAERWRITSGITPTWRCTQCACMFGHTGACAHGGPHRSVGMFPDLALREAAVVDRESVPHGAEPRFPGGPAAMLALRRTWQICRACGVVFTAGGGARCPAGGAKHVGGPKLVMSSAALEGWRVLVAMGETLRADRDDFCVRIVARDEGTVTVSIEPADAVDDPAGGSVAGAGSHLVGVCPLPSGPRRRVDARRG